MTNYRTLVLRSQAPDVDILNLQEQDMGEGNITRISEPAQGSW